MPTISTKKTKERKGPRSRQGVARETKILYIAISACAATLIIHLIFQVIISWRAGNQAGYELNALKAGRVLRLVEEAETFQRELEIAKSAAGERLAEKKRVEEMARRRSEDPALAVSDREKAQVKMKSLAPSETLPVAEVLKQMAKLASPPKSGVGVSVVKKGYRVEVAFPYSKVTEAHPELKTYLPGFYLEVRKTAAGIMNDLLRYGTPLGVVEVVVRCQGSATIQTKDGPKKEKRDLFGVSIVNDGRDWSQLTRFQMEEVWRKTTDQFPAMINNQR